MVQRRQRGSLHYKRRGKKGTFYVYGYDVAGNQFGKSLKTTDEREAKRLVRELSLELQLKKAKKRVLTRDDFERETEGYTSEEFYEASTRAILDDDHTQAIKKAMEEQWLKEKRASEKAQEAAEKVDNPTVDDFWVVYAEWCSKNRRPNTLVAQRTAWNRFVELTNCKHIGDINRKRVDTFIKKCEETDTINAGGIANYITQLKAIIGNARRQDFYHGPNPFAGIARKKRGPEKRKFLTRNQRDELLATLKDSNDAMYLFAAICSYCGLRRGEAIHLRWEDVDLEKDQIFVQGRIADKAAGIVEWQSKTGRNRNVPLAGELRAILVNRKQEKGYVLFAAYSRGRAQRTIDLEFPAIVKALNFDWCTSHSLRHTFASILLSEGVPIIYVSRWLGHANIQITVDTYGHLVKDGAEYIGRI